MQKSAHIPSPCSQSNTFGKVTSLLCVLFALILAESIYLYWYYTGSYNLHTTIKYENKTLIILQDNSAYAITMCWKLNCLHPSFLFLPEITPILNLTLKIVEAFSSLNNSMILWFHAHWKNCLQRFCGLVLRYVQAYLKTTHFKKPNLLRDTNFSWLFREQGEKPGTLLHHNAN